MRYHVALYVISLLSILIIFLKFVVKKKSVGALLAVIAVAGVMHVNLSPSKPYAKFGTVIGSEIIEGKTHEVEVISRDAIEIHSSRALLIMSLICFAAFLIRRNASGFMASICAINSIGIIWRWLFNDPVNFLLNNTSMDASLIAVTMPFFVKLSSRHHWSLGLLAMLAAWSAVIFTGSSVGVIALAISTIFMIPRTLIKCDIYSSAFFFVSILTAAIIAIYRFPAGDFMNDQGRFETWARSIKWLWASGYSLEGTGLGTFWAFGPFIQVEKNQMSWGIFTLMHNDWLQILFELGIIGFVLALLIYIKSVLIGYRERFLFPSLLSLGFVMTFNMPLRYPLFTLVTFLLYFEAKGIYERSSNKGRIDI